MLKFILIFYIKEIYCDGWVGCCMYLVFFGIWILVFLDICINCCVKGMLLVKRFKMGWRIILLV